MLVPFPIAPSVRNTLTPVGNTGVSRSPLNGATQTIGRGGCRWSIAYVWDRTRDDNEAALSAFLSALRGRTARVYVPDNGYRRKGSIGAGNIAPELLAANFNPVNAALVDTLRGIQVRQTMDGATGGADTYMAASAAHTEGRVYHLVAELHPVDFRHQFVVSGSPRNPTFGLEVSQGGTVLARQLVPVFDPDRIMQPARIVVSYVAGAPSISFSARTDVAHANDRFIVSHFRAARGLVVDNGVNLLGNNREFEIAASWPAFFATVGLFPGVTDPYGLTEARFLEDTTDNNSHFIKQDVLDEVSNEWIAAGVYLHADSLDHARLSFEGSGDGLFVVFDLAVGIVDSISVAGLFEQGWGEISDAGNGWYFCKLGCLADQATPGTVQFRIYTHDGATHVYAGTGSRLQMFAASVRRGLDVGREIYQPFSAVAGNDTPQSGNRLKVAGLDPNSPGALKAGDQVQLADPPQLVRLVADLEGDERGAGVMIFEPPLRASPADGTAIILDRPAAYMMLDQDEAPGQQRPYKTGGSTVGASLSFTEDLAP